MKKNEKNACLWYLPMIGYVYKVIKKKGKHYE